MLRLPALGYEIEEYSHGPTMAISKNKPFVLLEVMKLNLNTV